VTHTRSCCGSRCQPPRLGNLSFPRFGVVPSSSRRHKSPRFGTSFLWFTSVPGAPCKPRASDSSLPRGQSASSGRRDPPLRRVYRLPSSSRRQTSLHDLVRAFGLQACQVHLVSLRTLVRLFCAVNSRLPAEEIHPSEWSTGDTNPICVSPRLLASCGGPITYKT